MDSTDEGCGWVLSARCAIGVRVTFLVGGGDAFIGIRHSNQGKIAKVSNQLDFCEGSE